MWIGNSLGILGTKLTMEVSNGQTVHLMLEIGREIGQGWLATPIPSPGGNK